MAARSAGKTATKLVELKADDSAATSAAMLVVVLAATSAAAWVGTSAVR